MLHLIHPAMVHFTVAALVAGGICEAWGILLRRERFERFGGVVSLAGVASLVPTIVAGFLAANSIAPPPGSESVLSLHERAGLATGAVFAVLVLWKAWHRGRIADRQRSVYALLLLAGVALVVYAAWLGGVLVYTYGAGVGSP